MASKLAKPHYLNHYLPKRIIRLYLPFFIVFIINIIVLAIMGEPIKTSYFYHIPILTLPSTINWYLKVQLALYIVFYVLNKTIKTDNYAILITFIICCVYIAIGYLVNINRYWYESAFAFSMGMLLAKYKNKIIHYYKCYKLFTGCFSIIIFVGCLIPYYIKGGTLFEILYEFGFLILVLFICTLTYGSSIILKTMGRISLECYLVHLVIINAIISRLQFDDFSTFLNILVFLAYLLISGFGSFYLNKLITKISKLIENKLKLNVRAL